MKYLMGYETKKDTHLKYFPILCIYSRKPRVNLNLLMKYIKLFIKSTEIQQKYRLHNNQ